MNISPVLWVKQINRRRNAPKLKETTKLLKQVTVPLKFCFYTKYLTCWMNWNIEFLLFIYLFLDGLSSQWEAESQTRFQPLFPPEHLRQRTSSESQSNQQMLPNPPANSAIVWSGGSRQGWSFVLPPRMHPSAVSSDGLMAAEHQYSNSLLNFLHNDHPDLGTVLPSSKQDLTPGWTKYPGFGNQMTDTNLNCGKSRHFLPSYFNHTYIIVVIFSSLWCICHYSSFQCHVILLIHVC